MTLVKKLVAKGLLTTDEAQDVVRDAAKEIEHHSRSMAKEALGIITEEMKRQLR